MKIGVLGLQGDVREHARLVEAAGASPVVVKHDHELASIDGLILPGGESTTIGKLLHRFDLLDPLRHRALTGMPLYGTCAGAILMASEIVGREPVPHSVGVMDIAVTRNAYGRQVDSFEADLSVAGFDEPFRSIFIRAPVIEHVGPEVAVLASFDERPVLVRQGHLLASTFHPELAADPRIHRLFIGMIEEAG